jgi:hypothetical protein
MVQENQYHMTDVCGLSFHKATRGYEALYFIMIGRCSHQCLSRRHQWSDSSTMLIHIVGIIQVANISVSWCYWSSDFCEITRICQVMCGALEISKEILNSQPIVLVDPMALRYGTSIPNIHSTSSRGLSESFSTSRDWTTGMRDGYDLSILSFSNIYSIGNLVYHHIWVK